MRRTRAAVAAAARGGSTWSAGACRTAWTNAWAAPRAAAARALSTQSLIGEIVTSLETHPPSAQRRIPSYGVLDEQGRIRDGAAIHPELTKDVILEGFKLLVRSQTMDNILYESQRQGRLSFYLTSFGEEAMGTGAGLALQRDDDAYLQYREVGLLLARGFTVENVLDQCLATADDFGKGRQVRAATRCGAL